jgi:hypothetical protein
MKRFGDEVESVLGDVLGRHHMRLAEEHYQWSAFGSSYVVYERRNLKVRFVDDRKEQEIRCEVRQDAEKDWRDIRTLLPQQQKYPPSATLGEIANIVGGNLEHVADRLKKEIWSRD